MEKQRLRFKSGGYLEISGNDAAYVDSVGNDRHLTESEQTILAMLVRAGGQTVTYRALYEGYSKQTSFGEINQMVADIKTHMYPELKDCIRVSRGRGYRLDMTKFESETPPAPVSTPAMAPVEQPVPWLKRVSGDYYGFFLDPVGDGSVLGAYLHIENLVVDNRSRLFVNGILGIQSDHVLHHPELPAVFSGDRSRYYENYHTLKKQFSRNDRRCFFGTGEVRAQGTVVVIPMTTSLDSQWTMLLELGKFIYVQNIKKSEDYPYRGGLGLLVTLANAHGKFCCRCALVRKEFMRPTIRLTHPVIRDMLKIPDTLSWQPLKLDTQLDREWFNWFMKDEQ